MLENLTCLESMSVYDAMQVIDKNMKGMVFLVDQAMRLKGVLTDGDIRRLVLSRQDLNAPAFECMNKDFVYATHGKDVESVLDKFSIMIKAVPIVDDEFKLVDVFFYSSEVYIPVAQPDLSGNEGKYLLDAFQSTWISSAGEYIDRFENDFSSFCDMKYGLAVSNGTCALHLALVALGVGEGDEVIVPDLTFAATINAVLHVGARPVIVDIELESWTIDPKEIKKAITDKTKAIIPVHLYGQPCDMSAIMNLAEENALYVIEDCAQAHGASFAGRKTGSWGHVSCFSFFGNKILTTGEGGICLTNDEELLKKMQILRDHGMSKEKRYWHDVVGYNYRMTNLQAAIGVAQLERVDDILNKRSQIEKRYRKTLSGLEHVRFQKDDLEGCQKVTWFVCVLIAHEKRDLVMKQLKEIHIDSRPFFYSLSEMDVYKEYAFSNKNSKEISQCGVNLPTNFLLNDIVYENIREIFLNL